MDTGQGLHPREGIALPRDVFDRLDSMRLTVAGFDPFNVLRNVRAWRLYFAFCVAASLVLWATFGYEATWSQLLPFKQHLPGLLLGKVSLREVLAESRVYYGTGNHFSSPVIYGLAWIALSLHLERLGIKKSRNFILTSALSLANIGLMEWIYNPLYALCQRQPWVLAWRWKQMLNLLNFTLYSIVGLLTLLYLYADGYRPNLGPRTLLLGLAAAACFALWIFYPLPVETLTVETAAGTWTSGRLFPQTMYAIDLDPLDGVAVGRAFFVANDALHTVNLAAKACFTAFFLSLSMVKKDEKEKA